MTFLKYILTILSFFSFNCIIAQYCSNYDAGEILERYENRILGKLKSSGDQNVRTNVISCDYNKYNDTWKIKHTITFNGVWTGDYYSATGNLTVTPNNWDWKYIKGNDNMNALLLTYGLLEALAEESNNSSSNNYKNPYSPNSKIENIKVDYNKYEGFTKGMEIHSKININQAQYQECQIVVWFFYHDGRPLKGYNGKLESTKNQVCVWKNVTPSYENTEWKDFSFFLPYSELEITSKVKHSLYFDIRVYTIKDSKEIGKSSAYHFTYEKG